MSAPVASAEAAGPIAIIRRSWTLTSGHWWHLFGFLLLFFIGAIVLLLAVSAAAGVVAGLFFGNDRADVGGRAARGAGPGVVESRDDRHCSR